MAAASAKAESRPSVGLGMDLRLESEKLVGFALVHEGQMVHLCIFQNREGGKPDGFMELSVIQTVGKEEVYNLIRLYLSSSSKNLIGVHSALIAQGGNLRPAKLLMA